MLDPLRNIMKRFDSAWDERSNFRKLERYGVVLLYLILAGLFAAIVLRH
ncbi:MAG: hypothetical protein IPM52_14295 [Bacteroidetes bacterium]|nr:hypothetical protein [Bacteroidota bacterium]